jgi:hypothetical protein
MCSMQPPPTWQISYAEAASGLQHLQQAEFVYVRKGGVVPPLSSLYQGPYRVLDRRETFFKLEVRGRLEVVSVDRLKPHLGTAPVTAASPPQRGRPKGPGTVTASSSTLPASTGGAPVEDEIRELWRGKLRNIRSAYIYLFPDLCASLLLLLNK